jgi:hypothetical protein
VTRRTGAAVLLLLALGATAGCGGTDDPPASPAAAAGQSTPEDPFGSTPDSPAADASTAPAQPAVDACELVSKAEAEKLAGTALNAGQPVRETCTYTGPVTGPTAQVEVFVGDGAKKFLDIERTLGHELRALPGLGDEAWAGAEAVFVSKSGQWVSVRLVRLNDPAENRKPLEAVATLVAGRL